MNKKITWTEPTSFFLLRNEILNKDKFVITRIFGKQIYPIFYFIFFTTILIRSSSILNADSLFDSIVSLLFVILVSIIFALVVYFANYSTYQITPPKVQINDTGIIYGNGSKSFDYNKFTHCKLISDVYGDRPFQAIEIYNQKKILFLIFLPNTIEIDNIRNVLAFHGKTLFGDLDLSNNIESVIDNSLPKGKFFAYVFIGILGLSVSIFGTYMTITQDPPSKVIYWIIFISVMLGLIIFSLFSLKNAYLIYVRSNRKN